MVIKDRKWKSSKILVLIGNSSNSRVDVRSNWNTSDGPRGFDPSPHSPFRFGKFHLADYLVLCPWKSLKKYRCNYVKPVFFFPSRCYHRWYETTTFAAPGGLAAVPGERKRAATKPSSVISMGPNRTLRHSKLVGTGRALSMEKSKLWKGRPTWRSKRKMLRRPNAFDSDHRCSKVGTSMFQKVVWAFRAEFPRNPTGTKWVMIDSG